MCLVVVISDVLSDCVLVGSFKISSDVVYKYVRYDLTCVVLIPAEYRDRFWRET